MWYKFLSDLSKDFNNSDFQTLNAFITNKAFRVLETIKRYRLKIYEALRIKWKSTKADMLPFVDCELEAYRTLLAQAQEEMKYLMLMRKAILK